MTRFVTLNQFVNLWECDENDHMNVQFYFAKFDDAGAIFSLCTGLEEALGRRLTRHVRYHSELRGGAQLTISSAIVKQSDAFAIERGCFVQHVMRESNSGKLAATALDWHNGRIEAMDPALLDEIEPMVAPRGVTSPVDLAERKPGRNPQQVISRGVAKQALCNGRGLALDQAYIGAVSDAAAHAWDRIGLSTTWLDNHQFGRVAVEMRLCQLNPMKAGTIYQMQLAYTGLTSRAFNKRYDFFDLRDDQHIASLEATAMLINHRTRKSEPLPDFAREAIKASLGSGSV